MWIYEKVLLWRVSLRIFLNPIFLTEGLQIYRLRRVSFSKFENIYYFNIEIEMSHRSGLISFKLWKCEMSWWLDLCWYRPGLDVPWMHKWRHNFRKGFSIRNILIEYFSSSLKKSLKVLDKTNVTTAICTVHITPTSSTSITSVITTSNYNVTTTATSTETTKPPDPAVFVLAPQPLLLNLNTSINVLVWPVN